MSVFCTFACHSYCFDVLHRHTNTPHTHTTQHYALRLQTWPELAIESKSQFSCAPSIDLFHFAPQGDFLYMCFSCLTVLREREFVVFVELIGVSCCLPLKLSEEVGTQVRRIVLSTVVTGVGSLLRQPSWVMTFMGWDTVNHSATRI